jgi:CheY-like chemotaxis protein
VLIAHPEVEAGKTIADALSSWGLSPLLVHDGVEALLQIQRTLPKVVVLDAALPKMFGFQICEIMKRNDQLRVIPVVLIGAIHDQDRYRRPPPEELYGADAYVERHQLPDALADLLVRFGLGGPSPSAPAPAPMAAPVRPAAPAPAARPPAPAPRRPRIPSSRRRIAWRGSSCRT